MPTPDGILEAALYAPDLDAAATFYGDILGLTEVGRVSGRHVFYRVGAAILLIFRADATRDGAPPGAALPVPGHGAEGPGHVCFMMEARALDQLKQGLAARGVPVEADFRWPNGARSVYLRDPAGNSVEFAEPRLWVDPA